PPKVAKGPVVLRFWGVRGSIPTPGHETAAFGGNTSCVEMRVGDDVIILDAGSGIRGLGKALMRESKGEPMNIAMLVTHTHWDHIQGFPFFIPAYNPKVNVRILGYEGAVHGLRGALFEQMQSAFFPIGLNQMASHVTFEELEDMQFDLGAAKVRTIFSNHPGICLGYRLSTAKGDVVYMPDHEAYERHEVERQKTAGETSQPGLDYARSQDEKVIEFLRAADVMIADSQYDRVEYPTRLGWGHTCADDTVDLAIRAQVKQLFLFHHDPDHDDAKIEAMAAEGQARAKEQGSDLVVSAAREGGEFRLGS
ncbi:MAG TPA: MBL fold metallo-hydrolase, partial [Chthoniobacterales bacterium]|nr:MBL fold metallo-hydrolase [Chthoniobacterales bacterium]